MEGKGIKLEADSSASHDRSDGYHRLDRLHIRGSRDRRRQPGESAPHRHRRCSSRRSHRHVLPRLRRRRRRRGRDAAGGKGRRALRARRLPAVRRRSHLYAVLCAVGPRIIIALELSH